MNELEIKLGALLQVERERRNISLADLSNELKISESNLEAIERGDTSTLPSPLYYRLFAKSYATYLGIDYTKTVEAIQEDLEPPEAPIAEAEKPAGAVERSVVSQPEVTVEPEQRNSGILKKAVIIGVVIVAVFAVVLVGIKLLKGDERQTEEPAAGVEDLTQSVIVDSSQDTSRPSYDWSETTSTEPDSLRLTLTAKGQSWATVVTDGDTVIYQSLTPWRTYTTAAQFRLVVSIGVPGVVDVSLNGDPAYLADPQTGTVSRLEINQANRSEFKQPRMPERPPAPIPQPGGLQDTSRDTTSGAPTGRPTGGAGNR
jgi:cytoskeletal protein RodZ